MRILLPLLIALPVVWAALAAVVYRFNRRAADLITALVTLITCGFAIALYLFHPLNYPIVFRLFGISLVLDGLSHLLILTAGIVALFVAIYSISYMEKYGRKDLFYVLFMLMLAGIYGVVLSGDLIVMFIFLEMAALSAYALVAFGLESQPLEASFKYFIMGEAASAFILIAIGLVHAAAGTFDLAEAALRLQMTAPFIKAVALGLFLTGFGMKSALFPLHAWLPDAHTAAPSPISAMLSGVLIKALGIYAIVRVLFNVFGMTSQISSILMILGIISILVGVLLALGQWDFKRLLAYHSVSQIGYIALGVGLATPLGIMGGLYHLFNHAIFKSLLFLNAGSVESQIGTRDLKEMGGLSRKMPVTSATSLVASLSIAGIPPFNGFWSKLFIILACVQAGKIWLALFAVIGSILTLASFLKVQRYAFFGQAKETLSEIKESPVPMTIAMVSLALICLAIGLLSPFVINYLINPAVGAVANGVGYGRIVLGASK